jgi:hypothetical protein
MSIRISRYPVCRHTLTTGRRCKSPALTSSAFCFHHRKLRQARTSSAQPPLFQVAPDALHSPESIQHVLTQVFNGLTSGKLPPRPAGKMLYALQLAVTHQQTLIESGSNPEPL